MEIQNKPAKKQEITAALRSTQKALRENPRDEDGHYSLLLFWPFSTHSWANFQRGHQASSLVTNIRIDEAFALEKAKQKRFSISHVCDSVTALVELLTIWPCLLSRLDSKFGMIIAAHV